MHAWRSNRLPQFSWGAASGLQFHPGRRVIAGLFPAAGRPVDARGYQGLRQSRAEQEVVDPNAGIALEGIPPIVPEGVDSLVRMELAQGVGPALLDQLRELLSGLRREESVLGPALRLVHVL